MNHDTAAETDAGRTESVNEDAVLVRPLPESNGVCLAVADGMGGHQGGAVASETAIDSFDTAVTDALATESVTDDHAVVEQAYRRAHEAVRAQQSGDERMGTTLVTALVRGDRALVGNVGDSRAYRITADGMTQVTVDHLLVQELVDDGTIDEDDAAADRFQHVVTQSLGQDDPIDPDLYTADLTDATLLLCSDGLTAEVPDEKIATTVREASSAAGAATGLVDRANQNGGSDNISVVVVR